MSKKSNKQTTPLLSIKLEYTSLDGSKKEFCAKESLTASEIGALVEECVSSVVDAETGYKPYFKDLFRNCNILIFYTDILTRYPTLNLAEEVQNTDILDVLISDINTFQLEIIDKYINDLIDHKKKIIENKSEFDLLCGELRDLVKKLDKSVKPSEIKKIIKNFSSMNIDANTLADTLLKSYKNQDNVVPITKG